MKQPLPTLEQAISECLNNRDFMREYRRLSGHKLGAGLPIEIMVDEATGKLEDEAKQLFDFIRDWIWLPTIEEILQCEARP